MKVSRCDMAAVGPKAKWSNLLVADRTCRSEACLRNQSPSILQLFFKDQVHRLFLPARLFDFRTSAWLLKARAKACSS